MSFVPRACGRIDEARPERIVTDEYQIEVPPSFIALYLDARRRLSIPLRELRQRYEMCEDLAQQLIDHAEQLRVASDLPGVAVLERIRNGLAVEGSELTPEEATWVSRRLAELVGWNWNPETDADSK